MNTIDHKQNCDSKNRGDAFSIKAKDRWRLLRDRILQYKSYSYSQPSVYSNVDRIFGYSLLKRSASFSSCIIEQVLYLPRENGRIAIKTPSSIKVYDLKQFKLINEVLLTENENKNAFSQSYNRLAYASKVDAFIGWKPGGNTLWPLSCENLENIGIPSTTKNQLIGVFSNFDSGSIFSLELKSFKTFSNDYCWIIFARHWQFQFTEIQLIPNKCVPVLILKNYISFSSPSCREELFTKIVTCPLLKTLLETYEFPSQLISFEEKCSHNCQLLIGWKCSAWLRCMQFNRHFSSMSYNNDYDENDAKLLEMINFQTFENSVINHQSQITAVLYISPLNILITGDKCGTIKTWNTDQVQLSILHGHLGEIIHFSAHRWDLIRPQKFYSTSPSFVSISKDGLMKCWQFWQSHYIYLKNDGSESLNLSRIVSDNGTTENTIKEVDSRQTLMNLYSKILSTKTSASNTVHTIHDITVKRDTGEIVLVGVCGDISSCKIHEKCQQEYYLEHWTISEPCSPMAEFPQIVKNISFIRLNDLYDIVNPAADKSSNLAEYQNDNSINIAVVICEGKPGSVHLLSTLNGSILTTAVCEDTVEDATWHWMLEKLFILQSNGDIAVFSTCSRPCSLLSIWSSSEDDVFYRGPLLLYPVHSPDYFKLFLEDEKSSDYLPPVILLLLVGQSDGSLVVLCTKEGIIMSKTPKYSTIKSSNNLPEVDQKQHISSIKSNPIFGRLYTITLDGTLKVWQLITPLPIGIQIQKLDIFQRDKSNLRVYFTRFPFEIINNTDIYCIYTAKNYSLPEVGKTDVNCVTNSCYYNAICAEVTNPGDTYSMFDFITTRYFDSAYLNHENTTLLKDICIGLTNISILNKHFEKTPMIEQIFLTITTDPVEQEGLYLKVWQTIFDYNMGNEYHFRNSNGLKRTSIKTLQRLQMLVDSGDTGIVSLKCGLQLINTLRLPYPTGSRISKAVCRIVSIPSNGDILLTINNSIYLLHYKTLNKYFRLRSYLLNLMNRSIENKMIPHILQNVIRKREWNIDGLRKMNDVTLSMVCNIRQPVDHSLEEKLTAQNLSEKSKIFTKLKERDIDLKEISQIKFAKTLSKRHYHIDYASTQEARRIAFNNYYEKILSRQCLNLTSYSKELNNEEDEEITLLKERLLTTEQTYSQIQIEASVKKRLVKTSKQKLIKYHRTGKKQKLPQPSEDLSLVKHQETIKLPVITDNKESDLLINQRTNGFFPRAILLESGRSKYGWAPNSLLLGKYYSRLSHSGVDDKKNMNEFNWADAEARSARSSINGLESTLTSDSSIGWIVESDKELTMFSKEMSDGDIIDENTDKKLLASRFVDIDKSMDPIVSLSTLQNEISTEMERSQMSITEKSTPSSKKRNVIAKTDLKQSYLKETDLLSNLIERQAPGRPKYERENTIFLTEFTNTDSPGKIDIFLLPEFLQSFRNSRWLSIMGLLNGQEPEGWSDFNAGSNLDCFIQWLFWTNIIPKLCSQATLPCIEDEDPYLCQTISQFCTDFKTLFTDHQLSVKYIPKLHHCLTGCIINELGKTIEFKGWKMLEAVTTLLITFGFHDIDTVVILLVLYVKVLLTTEKDDPHYPEEIKNANLTHYIHRSLESLGFQIKYCNYLEEELSKLENIERNVKINPPKEVIHLHDCIHLVKNIETLNCWIKFYRLLSVWLENWFRQSNEITSKNKSPKLGNQLKSILHTTNNSTIKIKSINREVKWSKNANEVREEFITNDGIQALNTFVNWCHEQRLLKLREQAKAEQLHIDKLKQHINETEKETIIQMKNVNNDDDIQQHKVVMLLPPLNELERCVVRLGESYVTERRKCCKTENILQPWVKNVRQTKHGDIMKSQSLRDPTQPSYAQPWKSYKNALTGHFPPKIHIKPTECNLLPFDEHQPFKETLKQKLSQIQTLQVKVTNLKKENISKHIIPSIVNEMDSKDLDDYHKFLCSLIYDEEKRSNSIVHWFIPIMSSCLLPLPMKQRKLPDIKLPYLCLKLPYEKVERDGDDYGEDECEMLTKNYFCISDDLSTEFMSTPQND
uniref:WD_REPEATS_REGION domain-containing protein n=2 Tax=Schistosoma mansoni TaxID=6183 RepID=A0A5K4FFM3_SCHMA